LPYAKCLRGNFHGWGGEANKVSDAVHFFLRPPAEGMEDYAWNIPLNYLN